MQLNIERDDTVISWTATLAGASLFVLWGLVMVSGKIPHHWGHISWANPLAQDLFLAVLVIPLVAVFFGWKQHFPRWSFPFVGHTIFFSLYMTHVATPRLTFLGYPLFGTELWGWRAWMPLAAVALVSLLSTRSLEPLRAFVYKTWQDWTLLTFALAGILPLIAGVAFDDIERAYAFRFLVALALIPTGAALVYLHSRDDETRKAALITGIITTLAVALVCSNAYWNQKGIGHLYDGLLDGVMVILIMLSPAVIGLLHRERSFEVEVSRAEVVGQGVIDRCE